MGNIAAKEPLAFDGIYHLEAHKVFNVFAVISGKNISYKLGELANPPTISRSSLLLTKTWAIFADSCRISSKAISNLYRSAGSHSSTASITIVAGLASKRARISSTYSPNSSFFGLLPYLSASSFFL
jgi:hypothetical protein